MITCEVLREGDLVRGVDEYPATKRPLQPFQKTIRSQFSRVPTLNEEVKNDPDKEIEREGQYVHPALVELCRQLGIG